MKILLNCYYTKEHTKIQKNYFPTGLLSLAAYSSKRLQGISITILDGPLEINDIVSCKPDLLGIMLASPLFSIGCQTIQAIKMKYPGLPIILGGYHITYLPENLPGDCEIGVLGEGEETFFQLL